MGELLGHFGDRHEAMGEVIIGEQAETAFTESIADEGCPLAIQL